MIRSLALALFLAALPSLVYAGQPTTITFQGRLRDITIVNIAPDVIVSAASDIIFVKTADAKKFLCLPQGQQRGDYDIVNQRFYMLDVVDGDVFGFSQITGTLINLDGTFFSALNQDALPSEIIQKPISIPSTEFPTDIAIIDNQRIAFRTDGPSNPDINNVPIEDEKVYVLTRQAGAAVELPTLTVPLKDADLPNCTSVFVEWDAINQTFILLQNQLADNTRNADLRDRLTAIQRDGTVTSSLFLSIDAINTPNSFFPTYSGNIGGVSIDPETNVIYMLDPAARQIIVLTPRDTQILSVAPNKGPAFGGTAVTLTGANFPPDAQVFFDGVAATNVVVVSTTSITCVTPAHALGAVNVTVTGTGIPILSPSTLIGGFTYENVPPTAVLQASPSRGPAPLAVNFDISNVSDADGTIASRVLFFGDGQSFTFPPNLAVTSTPHTYTSEGVYTAALTVTDNLGGTAFSTKLIVVGDDLPLVVRTLSIRTQRSDAEDTSRDTMSLNGEFVLPEDLDISDAEVSVGFALSSAPALGEFNGDAEPVFTENVNGGQYDGVLVPTKSGKTGKLPGRAVKFTYKAFKRPGVTPSTFTFNFSGKTFEIFDALEKSVVTANGDPIKFATLTDPKSEDFVPTLATFTVIVRVTAGADILNFKKPTVIELRPSKSGLITVRRR